MDEPKFMVITSEEASYIALLNPEEKRILFDILLCRVMGRSLLKMHTDALATDAAVAICFFMVSNRAKDFPEVWPEEE